MTQRFGPEYWDKHGCYRTPLGFILTLIILLRSYVIWLLAAISRKPELDLVSLMYQKKHDFFLALGIGAIALLPTLIYFLRRPQYQHTGLKKLWRVSRYLLLLAVLVDGGYMLLQAADHYYRFSFYLAIQLVLVAWCGLYLLTSRYLSVYFNDWPSNPSSG